MKRKNSHRPRPQQLARLGIALVCIPLAAALLILSLALGWLHGNQSALSPLDALVDRAYFGAPAYTILQEVAVPEPSGTLFLVGWHNPDATACIGLVWVTAPRFYSDSVSVGHTNAHCPRDTYSIDQFWGMRTWQRIPFSVAFGYSGGADKMVVIWQDDMRTELKPVAGSYLAINPAKSRVIETVDFFDVTGKLLHRFPDWAKSPVAES